MIQLPLIHQLTIALQSLLVLLLAQQDMQDVTISEPIPVTVEDAVLDDKSETTRINFSDDFENELTFDTSTAWKVKQLVRGTVEVVDDPMDSTNQVLMATAGARILSKVGKADLIKKFLPIPLGSTISVTADFYFPEDSDLDSVHLIDIECGECGVDTNPGPRLYIRDGRLRIDRGKIGFNDSFNQSVDVTLQRNQWHTIKWSLTTGEGDAGQTLVWLDGQKVIDESGTNILTQSVLDQYSISLTSDHMDSVQVGLTANSNSTEQTLYFDNVTIEVKE